jgi:hypothetical protein
MVGTGGIIATGIGGITATGTIVDKTDFPSDRLAAAGLFFLGANARLC